MVLSGDNRVFRLVGKVESIFDIDAGVSHDATDLGALEVLKRTTWYSRRFCLKELVVTPMNKRPMLELIKLAVSDRFWV